MKEKSNQERWFKVGLLTNISWICLVPCLHLRYIFVMVFNSICPYYIGLGIGTDFLLHPLSWSLVLCYRSLPLLFIPLSWTLVLCYRSLPLLFNPLSWPVVLCYASLPLLFNPLSCPVVLCYTSLPLFFHPLPDLWFYVTPHCRSSATRCPVMSIKAQNPNKN